MNRIEHAILRAQNGHKTLIVVENHAARLQRTDEIVKQDPAFTKFGTHGRIDHASGGSILVHAASAGVEPLAGLEFHFAAIDADLNECDTAFVNARQRLAGGQS